MVETSWTSMPVPMLSNNEEFVIKEFIISLRVAFVRNSQKNPSSFQHAAIPSERYCALHRPRGERYGFERSGHRPENGFRVIGALIWKAPSGRKRRVNDKGGH